MDFNDTASEAAFREEAREWLHNNYPDLQEQQGMSELELAKMWQKRKFDAGWACITWPNEHGGRGASAIEQVIWDQEESNFESLGNPFVIGQGMAAPTLMAWAGKAHCERYLPPLASGDEIWCQLFSEPGSGSDLAGLQTKAQRSGDDWIVSGQKVWTSFAHYADYAVLVARTDSGVAKHDGLTYFFIDMKAPGVEVKPIKQISGVSNFNEVFLSGVKVPDAQRLGEVGQGWQVALTTLMNERATAGEADDDCNFEALYELACVTRLHGKAAIEDSHVRAKLADWYCQEAGLRYTTYRSITALSKGETPGPENAIGKLVNTMKSQDMASFAIDLLATDGIVSKPEEASREARFHSVYLTTPGTRIAGGTDEILLNIIAERVLGLPQDIRVDKGIPFSDIPTSQRSQEQP